MDNLIFYKDTFIGKELAYVLGIEYNYIDEINKYTLDGKKVYVDDKDEKDAIDKGLARNKEYILLDDILDYLDNYSRVVIPNATRDIKLINIMPVPSLTLSQLLIKVLKSTPKDIDCTMPLINSNVDVWGNIWGCCPKWIEIPLANILLDEDVYDNYYCRIIRLSAMNKTFCFCDLTQCKYYGAKDKKGFIPESLDTPKYPEQFTISTDKTCNLRCNSCRKDFYKPCDMEIMVQEAVTDKIIEQGLLDKSILLMAGQGEVFLSKNYLRMIESVEHGGDIRLMTNAVLFSPKKWKLLEGKFDNVCVSVSIDAATKETYAKLRHGPFDILLKNLKMIGDLRKEGKVSWYTFNFVVQRENMHEMVDFVKLAKSVNVDKVQFTRLNDWGTFTQEEYKDKCLIVDEKYLDKELYEILKDPIFKDPIVDIDFLKLFIENSKKKYEKE